mmetsp:Transcript_5906/g.14013  ORF Transcript_5906/g.14013 Transcript_5906/m.14013 type:complete len:229 (-) Transcript_5906:109-795(-)
MGSSGSTAWILLAAARGAVRAEQVHVVNGVMKLEESNFDTMVKKFPTLLVNFYAPWCGGCNGFASTYEKVARKLKKRAMPAPRLAKVDVTVEPRLEKRFDAKVNVHPVLLIFRNGELFARHEGVMAKQELQDYAESVSLPLPVGALRRMQLRLRGLSREMFTLLGLPTHYRVAVETALPVVVLVAPSLALMLLACSLRCCCACCHGHFCRRNCDRSAGGTDNAVKKGN